MGGRENKVVYGAGSPAGSGGLVEKTPLERYQPPAKPSLVGLSRAQLAEALASIGVPAGQRKMRVPQIWPWLYLRGARRVDAMTRGSEEVGAVLDEHFPLAPPPRGAPPRPLCRRRGSEGRPAHDLQHRHDGHGRAALQFRGGARRALDRGGRRRNRHLQTPDYALDVGGRAEYFARRRGDRLHARGVDPRG